MKILVIEGSPHKNGSSNLLAEQFVKGAEEAGHKVAVFDAAHMKINPCLGCDACGMAGSCTQKDDMEQLKDLIRENDMLVFVTPLYYFGMSAQLKAVVDRFYSFHMELTNMKKKSALIVAAMNPAEQVMSCMKDHYHKIADYMQFEDQGMILGIGCGTPAQTEQTIYPRQAYEFGKAL